MCYFLNSKMAYNIGTSLCHFDGLGENEVTCQVLEKLYFNRTWGTFLVVQWLRIHLPGQGQAGALQLSAIPGAGRLPRCAPLVPCPRPHRRHQHGARQHRGGASPRVRLGHLRGPEEDEQAPALLPGLKLRHDRVLCAHDLERPDCPHWQ